MNAEANALAERKTEEWLQQMLDRAYQQGVVMPSLIEVEIMRTSFMFGYRQALAEHVKGMEA